MITHKIRLDMILVRSDSFVVVNSIFKVKINEDVFDLRVVED